MLYSLRWRLLLSFGLVIAIAVGAVALFATQAANTELRRHQQRIEQERSERLRMLLARQYAKSRGWGGIQPIVEQVGEIYGQRIILTDMRGMVIADSKRRMMGRRIGRIERGRIMPVMGRDGQLATLLINPQPLPEPTPPPPSPGPSVNRYLLWSGLLAGGVALLLTFFLSRRILAPVEALSRAARGLARGDFSQRVDVRSRDEVGELARTFNTMAEELKRADEMRRNLVADVAHELRTPLTNIRGYIEAIRDGLVKPDAATLNSIYEEVLLLSRLIEDLQLLALAEAGQLPLHLQTCDLSEVVRKAAAAVQPQAEAKGLSLTVAVPGRLPVRADPERTGQVLRNLLTNAVNYTPRGGRITVAVEEAGEEAEVRVVDTGVGIPPEELPYIFERFYRVDKSRSRATGGTGLGLTIARRLVEAQGGRMRAESQVGRGSTFIFTLPKGGKE
jgi:signal transduction histidine kinase